MRTLLTICCAACLWLALSTTSLQAQVVPIDFSQAVEMKVVWKMLMCGVVFPITFVQNVCGG